LPCSSSSSTADHADVEDFDWWIRGGPSTMRRKGVEYDCFAAAA
jgi:hypothetical protein